MQAPLPPSPAGPSHGSPSDDADHESVRAWVAAWGAEVAAVDLSAGRRRFHPDAVAFGTHADLVRGVDDLHDQQWSAIWPNIAEFRFDHDHLVALVSPDRLHAVAITTWGSTGFTADGQPFDRPGRATIVLLRSSPAEEWICTHTHFSLARGVPDQTHGAPATP